MTKQVIIRAALITVAVMSFVGLTMPAQATSYGDVIGTDWPTTEQDYSTSSPTRVAVISGGDTESVLPGHTNISHAMTTHSSGVKIGFGIGLMAIGFTAVLIFLSRWIVDYRRRQLA
jgi:hypothetical protein